jgi:protein ImuB
MGRIACLVVPDFSIAALVRANPSLAGEPLATVDSLAPHSELLSVSGCARGFGVRPGMTLAQAHSIVPDLVAMNRSLAAERSAAGALSDAAESLSPIVEPGDAGCVYLGLAGLGRLHGSEEEIASELCRRADRLGMEAAAGIAANKEIAYLAARCGGIRVIAPGMDREFLDWLPLDVLGLDDALETTLARWGLRRLGDLARLDSDAVGSRLGRRGVELVRIARGEESSPLVPRRAAETFAEETELDYEIENLEALSFVMRPMVERLADRLSLRGFAAGGVTLSMGLAGRRNFIRRVALGAPSIDVRAILTFVALSLEASSPDSAIESIRIDAEPHHPRPAQADMFLPPSPAPDRLETTIARLAALCGPENVGLLRPENSWFPEAVRLERFDPPAPRPDNCLSAPSPVSSVARLVVRAIRPALEIEVLCARGRPEFVRGPNLGARVVSLAGPWRHSMPAGHSFDSGHDLQCAPVGRRHSMPTGHSFDSRHDLQCAPVGRISDNADVNRRHGMPRRDYYELALADGGVYRVFCDLDSERWFVDGMYD